MPGIRTGAGPALEQHHTMTLYRCRFCAIPPAHADAKAFTIFDHNPDMPIKPPFRLIVCHRDPDLLFSGRALVENLVDQAEINCLLWRHEMVAIKSFLNNIIRLSRMLDVNLVQPALHLDDVLRMAFDI